MEQKQKTQKPEVQAGSRRRGGCCAPVMDDDIFLPGGMGGVIGSLLASQPKIKQIPGQPTKWI